MHYAGLRNPVTAWEVLNIGDVIRRGKLTEEGTKEHPTSRRYELETENGEKLKVIVDFSEKNDKNKSVINFYSDRKSALSNSFGIFTSPHTVLIDKNSMEIGRIRGSVDWDDDDVIEYIYNLSSKY